MNVSASLVLLLVLALTVSCLAQDQVQERFKIDCDEEMVECGPNDKKVCILHPTWNCFTAVANRCEWHKIKCQFGVDYNPYRMEHCKNKYFACKVETLDSEDDMIL